MFSRVMADALAPRHHQLMSCCDCGNQTVILKNTLWSQVIPQTVPQLGENGTQWVGGMSRYVGTGLLKGCLKTDGRGVGYSISYTCDAYRLLERPRDEDRGESKLGLSWDWEGLECWLLLLLLSIRRERPSTMFPSASRTAASSTSGSRLKAVASSPT